LVAAAALVASAGLVLSGCSSGPSTKAEVCATYDELGTQLLQGNGVFGNPLFHKAEDLADVADRYEGSPSLAGDAAALADIADSDSTSGEELMAATGSIASLCGYPLGMSAMFQP
jgi:hypothetical protein